MRTLQDKLLQFVRDNPGATGPEIHNYFRPNSPKTAISSTLGRLRRMGVIEHKGHNGPYTRWYPTTVDKPEPEFLDTANMLLKEMQKLPKSERETFLALFLQNFNQR